MMSPNVNGEFLGLFLCLVCEIIIIAPVSQYTYFLYCALLLIDISPTTVVSSANLIIVFVVFVG